MFHSFRLLCAFAYSWCRVHIRRTAFLIGALSSRHTIFTAAITDTQNRKRARTVGIKSLSFWSCIMPHSPWLVTKSATLKKKKKRLCIWPQLQCNNRVQVYTWSECRMLGQERELELMGNPAPGGLWLKYAHLSSSHNKTGCSGEPGRSCEGRRLYSSGLDLLSQACGLQAKPSEWWIHALYMQNRPHSSPWFTRQHHTSNRDVHTSVE